MMTLQILIKRNRNVIYMTYIFISMFFIVQNLFANKLFENKNVPVGEIYEKLDKKIDLNLIFTNQDGKKQSIKDLFKNENVLVMTLNYYKCTTMCTFQFVNLASSIKKMGWKIGNGFRIATISFDPNDTSSLAKEKQKLWVPKTGQKDAEWDFFVGDNKNINSLVRELNFYYEFEPSTGEYSHGAALFFIKPDGTFYRYLYGIVYEPQDIKQALIESSNGKLGSFLERLYSKFKKYQSQTGKYASW